MRQAGWYSLKEKDDYILVSYRISNRIIAGISFLLILSFVWYYLNTGEDNVFTVGIVIAIILLIFLFFMCIAVDSYKFFNNVCIRGYGVFPFTKRKRIELSSIEDVVFKEIVKKTFRSYIDKKVTQPPAKYFSISLNFKNGKIDYLGIFYRTDFSYQLAEKIKRIFLNALKK